MKFYVNDKIVTYEVFKHYLLKSIKHQASFTLSEEDARFMYCSYFNEMKYYKTEVSFNDKMKYKIR